MPLTAAKEHTFIPTQAAQLFGTQALTQFQVPSLLAVHRLGLEYVDTSATATITHDGGTTAVPYTGPIRYINGKLPARMPSIHWHHKDRSIAR